MRTFHAIYRDDHLFALVDPIEHDIKQHIRDLAKQSPNKLFSISRDGGDTMYYHYKYTTTLSNIKG